MYRSASLSYPCHHRETLSGLTKWSAHEKKEQEKQKAIKNLFLK